MRLYQYAQLNEILYYSNYSIYTICYVFVMYLYYLSLET